MTQAFAALEAQLETQRLLARPQSLDFWRHFVGSDQSYYRTRHMLADAAPYFWAGEQCRLIDAVAPSVPEHWTPIPTATETHSGYFLFDTPLALPTDVQLTLRAIAWSFANDVLWAACFCEMPEDRGPGGFPQMTVTWRLHMSLDMLVRTGRAACESEFLADGTWACQEHMVRLLAAAFAFLEQRILITRPERPPRFVRRRLPAAREDTRVHVVILRRTQRSPTDAAGEHPMAWSCRWIVRGHWRDQWFPSLGRHRPLWILPYEKGPEEQPLRMPGATVFAVVR
jgi:hypothetical protein